MNDKTKVKSRMPEWAPSGADRSYASRIVEGRKAYKQKQSTQSGTATASAGHYDLDMLVEGILASDRTTLSKAITLIESNSLKHFEPAQELIKKLIPHSGNSVRIGITGVPGAGKSTLIEALGMYLIQQGHKVAVLAIDPSSTISKGSILGDKTRMEKLSRDENSFIRPSPSSGILGGVARKTRETIIACEAAGYNVVLIETVGVGQSEVTVRSLVDFFLLIQITGAGDELQGIKKGIIELVDLIVINKADGDNIQKAEVTKNDITRVLHYVQQATHGWQTLAVTCSALSGANVPQIWNIIEDFRKLTAGNGEFNKRRSNQQLEWLDSLLQNALYNLFFSDNDLHAAYERYRKEILSGKQTPALAASQLMDLFIGKK